MGQGRDLAIDSMLISSVEGGGKTGDWVQPGITRHLEGAK